MLTLALALVATLLAVPGPALTSRPADTLAVVPRRFVLDLVIDPASATWTGSLRGWLTVRRPVRAFVLRFANPTTSRVEMNQLAGATPLAFGTRGRDSLLVVTDRPMVAGPAGLNVGWVAAFADTGRGAVRTGRGAVAIVRGAGTAYPAFPRAAPAAAWTVDVHVPAGSRVRANLPSAGITRQLGWRTWEFVSRGPLDPDSLRISVVAARERR